MKPHKFKIWDQEKKIFFPEEYINSVTFWGDGTLAKFDGGNPYDKLDEDTSLIIYDNHILNNGMHGIKDFRYIPLRYTGMLDGKGYQIYEGDFIKYKEYDDRIVCGAVLEKDGCYGICEWMSQKFIRLSDIKYPITIEGNILEGVKND